MSLQVVKCTGEVEASPLHPQRKHPNIRFPGQYYDKETERWDPTLNGGAGGYVEGSGLHYNRFRYYDPEIGRYVSADPIGQAGGVNVFAYADLNPLRMFDFLGLSPQSDLAEVLAFFSKCYGELSKNNPDIEFDEGLEEKHKLGTTNTFTGNIKLNPNQSQDSLAGTAAHELQHSAEGLTGRLQTKWQDLTDPDPATGVGPRHSEIFSREFDLQQHFMEWKKRKDETGCDECKAEDCVCGEP